MNKTVFIPFLFLILTQCRDKPAVLQNGKYKVEFTGEFSVVTGYEIEVIDSLLVEMESNIKKTYKIHWRAEDIFQLELIPTGNKTLTDINIPFPQKYPYYKMTNSQKDTQNFDYHQGNAVSTATGRFVRIRK